eukprot:CAMPEP_0201480196 /NCGR_PEP_ID=MMETSP0151_2-20130828/4733_1 /ASSEMBLY_ACC=CAM_ASM_000257 /TAXON_ID=200890 /ORGANISM="Paramoeba atlantica, Strain 621/1 / CCAP 1560/9" /LENGTH=150 /DNA_ID=CAMNT_0047861977 /DNA_START=128 /DNA_END=580 /DNA_ORIENTATION=+
MMQGSDYLQSLDIFGGKDESKIIIEEYNDESFVVNGVHVVGPQLLFPTIALHWNVPSLPEATIDDFQPVVDMFPKIDILIIGTGETMASSQFDTSITQYLKNQKIAVEPMATWHAIGTFNILNQENRRVAAVLWPHVFKGRSPFDLLNDE